MRRVAPPVAALLLALAICVKPHVTHSHGSLTTTVLFDREIGNGDVVFRRTADRQARTLHHSLADDLAPGSRGVDLANPKAHQ